MSANNYFGFTHGGTQYGYVNSFEFYCQPHGYDNMLKSQSTNRYLLYKMRVNFLRYFSRLRGHNGVVFPLIDRYVCSRKTL